MACVRGQAVVKERRKEDERSSSLRSAGLQSFLGPHQQDSWPDPMDSFTGKLRREGTRSGRQSNREWRPSKHRQSEQRSGDTSATRDTFAQFWPNTEKRGIRNIG